MYKYNIFNFGTISEIINTTRHTFFWEYQKDFTKWIKTKNKIVQRILAINYPQYFEDNMYLLYREFDEDEILEIVKEGGYLPLGIGERLTQETLLILSSCFETHNNYWRFSRFLNKESLKIYMEKVIGDKTLPVHKSKLWKYFQSIPSNKLNLSFKEDKALLRAFEERFQYTEEVFFLPKITVEQIKKIDCDYHVEQLIKNSKNSFNELLIPEKTAKKIIHHVDEPWKTKLIEAWQ